MTGIVFFDHPSHCQGQNVQTTLFACSYCLVTRSCLTLLWPHGVWAARLLCPWDFPGKNTGVSCHFCFLLQGIFLTQGLKLHLLLCRQIFYCWATLLAQLNPVAQSCPTLQPHGPQHTRLPCPPQTTGACSISCPSIWWCHPTILSSVIPFSSCLHSFPASGSFPVSQFFSLDGQSIGASALV